MKKISSLLLALCVFCAAFAEVTPLDVAELSAPKAAAVEKHAPAFLPETKQADKAAALKLQGKKAHLEKVGAAPSKVAAAVTDEVVAINGKLEAEEMEGFYDMEWYVTIENDNYRVILDILSPTLPGAYTVDSIDPDYSVIYDYTGDSRKTVYFNTFDFTVAETADGAIDLKGQATGSDGITYVINGHKDPLPQPKDTVKLTFNDAILVDGSYSFQLYGTELFPEVSKDSIYVSLAFYKEGKSIEGSYEYKDRLLYANVVEYQGKDTVIIDPWEILNATVTTNSGLYVCKANFFGTDSIFYQITLYTDAPEPLTPKKTVDFWAKNLKVESYVPFYDLVMFGASNDDYYALIGVKTSSVYGNYTENDLYSTSVIMNLKDSTTLSILQANLECTNWQGVDMLYGSVIASDTVQYNILFDWEAPDAKDTVVVNFTEPGEAIWFNNLGDSYFYNADSKYIFSLDVYGDSICGSYTEKDLYSYYSYLGIINGTDTTGVTVLTADIKVVSTGENTCLVTANILASDTIFYKVTTSVVYVVNGSMDYDATAADGAVDRVFTSADNVFEELYTEDYAYLLSVKSTASMDAFQLEFYLPTGAEKLLAGTYTIDKSQKEYTVYACDGYDNGYIYPSFYTHLSAKGQATDPIYFLESGTVVVEYVGENLKVTVDAKNSNDVPVKIVYDASLTALDNTTEAVSATKYIRNGKLYIEAAGHIYDATGALLQ